VIAALTRRTFAGALLAAPVLARAQSGPRVSIGYQKSGPLALLRQQKRLEAAGIAATWAEFQSGPPLLEALSAGAVDFGYTGDTPPIFAQAAGSSLLYVAGQPITGVNEAVLVRADGPLRTVADLRGKRVAYARGSSAHYVLVKALEAGGLRWSDIEAVNMQPADAAAAFRAGALDAWSIWDPFFAIAQGDAGTRVLTTGENIAPSDSFLLASRAFTQRDPALLDKVLEQTNAVAAWAKANPDALAEQLSAITGVPLPAQRVAAARAVYAFQPIDAAIVARQQAVADTFSALHLIPSKVDVAAAVWRPVGKQASVAQ
jgi:sulfonate transport system substrate-binding protein